MTELHDKLKQELQAKVEQANAMTAAHKDQLAQLEKLQKEHAALKGVLQSSHASNVELLQDNERLLVAENEAVKEKDAVKSELERSAERVGQLEQTSKKVRWKLC